MSEQEFDPEKVERMDASGVEYDNRPPSTLYVLADKYDRLLALYRELKARADALADALRHGSELI